DRLTTYGLDPARGAEGTTAAVLEAPADTRITVPFTVGVVLVVCVAFTIFAGVSSPVIDYARQATLLF
ncbi:MAG: hypothetical protein ACRDXE_11305, partial [Acidimicrobiales bacterium]